MWLAVAIYFLAVIGLVQICVLLSKGMLKAHAWLTTNRRRPFTLARRNAMLDEIEKAFSQAWEASER